MSVRYCCHSLLQVYDTLIAIGVPPHVSQFNALLEQYALRFQLGSVVSVLTTMVNNGVQPNANTFRCVCVYARQSKQHAIQHASVLQLLYKVTITACFSLDNPQVGVH